MRTLTAKFQKRAPGNLYNLEAAPAEGTSYRFGQDRQEALCRHPGLGQWRAVLYQLNPAARGCHTADIFTALEHQDKLQPLYTGGTVFHSFLGESVPDIDALRTFIVRALSETKIPYISITPTFSVCKDHGYLTGEQATCPRCGQEETEVYARVVGYYRPVKMWNKGKRLNTRTGWRSPRHRASRLPRGPSPWNAKKAGQHCCPAFSRNLGYV